MEITQSEVKLRRIGVLSAGIFLAVMYAILGLVVGLVISLLAFAGASAFGQGAGGILFGVGAVIALPLFYGIAGFIGGIIMAAIYNIVAKLTGGIEMEFAKF
ncbi:MAG: hypothetical protein O2821_03880 [Chloroflexi bacterium]|nr:hypothetical protein [Chloroflexota bacterium]